MLSDSNYKFVYKGNNYYEEELSKISKDGHVFDKNVNKYLFIRNDNKENTINYLNKQKASY